MTRRSVVEIDQEKCDGCGRCVSACAEGAIQIVDGKARLVSDTYCDGLGACLGECPQNAITIIHREAAPFDEAAVHSRPAPAMEKPASRHVPAGCPGAAMQDLRLNVLSPIAGSRLGECHASPPACGAAVPAARAGETPAPQVLVEPPLGHWPIQLHLISPVAPPLKEADLFLVADCVPFACDEFHRRILRGRPVVIGCPKLDDGRAYVQKLADIFRQSATRSLTVVHMEVPCCTNFMRIAAEAIKISGAMFSIDEITISRRGQILGGPASASNPEGS
jgi:Pyruvate/2-oxoacid:ferredoxin oxidoreductase delta subunit